MLHAVQPQLRLYYNTTKTNLFILISCDRNKLGLRERLTADHFLNASNFHNVYPGFIFVQGIQHNLKNQNHGKINLNYYKK